jgi:hypothetical protein
LSRETKVINKIELKKLIVEKFQSIFIFNNKNNTRCNYHLYKQYLNLNHFTRCTSTEKITLHSGSKNFLFFLFFRTLRFVQFNFFEYLIRKMERLKSHKSHIVFSSIESQHLIFARRKKVNPGCIKIQ